MKKIAILSDADPTDRRSWSGTQYSVYLQLSKYYEIDVYVTDTSWAFKVDRISFKIITLSHGMLRLGLLNCYMSSRKVDKILSKRNTQQLLPLDLKIPLSSRTKRIPLSYFILTALIIKWLDTALKPTGSLIRLENFYKKNVLSIRRSILLRAKGR
jgi:hypothetical protein